VLDFHPAHALNFSSARNQEEDTAMAVNQGAANKEIRDQLMSALEAGHADMALSEATRAFPASVLNSRLPRVPYSFWELAIGRQVAGLWPNGRKE